MAMVLSKGVEYREITVWNLCALPPLELLRVWGERFPKVLRCSSEIISSGCDVGYAYGYREKDPELALDFYKLALSTYDDWGVEPSVGYLEFIRLGMEILGRLNEEKFGSTDEADKGMAYSLAMSRLSKAFASGQEDIPSDGKGCLHYLRNLLCPEKQ